MIIFDNGSSNFDLSQITHMHIMLKILINFWQRIYLHISYWFIKNTLIYLNFNYYCSTSVFEI